MIPYLSSSTARWSCHAALTYTSAHSRQTHVRRQPRARSPSHWVCASPERHRNSSSKAMALLKTTKLLSSVGTALPTRARQGTL